MDTEKTPRKPKHGKKETAPRMSISISTPTLSSLARTKKNIHESPAAATKSSHKQDALRLYRTVPSYRYLLRDIIKADIAIMDKRSFLLCPHRHHCIQHALFKGLWRTFSAAFIFKTSLAFLSGLIAGKIIHFRTGRIGWRLIKKIYLSRDSLLFALVFALMSFSYKCILCALRRYRRRDALHYKTIAGFICGVFICLDNRQRRNTIALYCVIRALSDFIKLCVAHKKLPCVQHLDVAAFTASQMAISYAAMHDPQHLDPKYYQWFLKIGNLTEAAVQNTLRSPSGAMFRLPHELFTECCPTWHAHPSCFMFSAQDWFYALARSAKMYVGVHFLPALLLTPKTVFRRPWKYLRRKSWNTLISSMFLATYIFNMRLATCTLRNWLRKDTAFIAICAGFAGGLSLFIENEHRRPELMLYCLPRALEWLIKSVRYKQCPWLWKLLRTRLWPTLMFQLAVAMWCTIWNVPKGAQCSNSINMTVLNVVLGTNH